MTEAPPGEHKVEASTDTETETPRPRKRARRTASGAPLRARIALKDEEKGQPPSTELVDAFFDLIELQSLRCWFLGNIREWTQHELADRALPAMLIDALLCSRPNAARLSFRLSRALMRTTYTRTILASPMACYHSKVMLDALGKLAPIPHSS